MKRTANPAFTLIELLIVIAIVAVLASIVFPVFSSIQLSAKRTQSLSNMRQLGTALLAYCGDNNGALPTEGDAAPTWPGAAANTTTEQTAWYNALPRTYANSKGAGDYANDKADFYAKGSMFYVPAAKYPSTKITGPGPLFAVAFCSKIYDGTFIPDNNYVRLPNFLSPAETCIFQESGLPGETPIRTSQSSYNGQSKSFASRSVARYGGKTILVFADGHADLLAGTDIVTTSGKAYSPQISAAGGKVYWTMNPSLNANQ